MGNHNVIAFLQYDGRTLVLELSPLPGKPGYFDAAVVKLTGTDKPQQPRKMNPSPVKRRRRAQARPETTKLALALGEWLSKNPGTHPLYSTVQKVLGIKSAGTSQNVVREAARMRQAKFEVKSRPHTVSSVETM